MAKQERKIIDDILSTLPENKRLFRINAGMAWAGGIVRQDRNNIILRNQRPFHGAPKGWPDLAGWETIEITSDMIGQKIAVFVAEEVKATGSLSNEQENFKNTLEKMGGIFRIIQDQN